MDTLKKFIALVAFAFLAFPAVALASDGEFRFETNGEEFKVEGMVSDVADNAFVVDGFVFMMDPTMVDEFEIEGEVTVGAEVEAEGMVVDGVNFAEEVKAEGAEVEDEDEVEDEVDEVEDEDEG